MKPDERTTALDRVILMDLIGAVLLSVLAFGAVEPWSLALFELNALLLAALVALRFVLLGGGGAGNRLRLALPMAAMCVWGGAQLFGGLSLDPQGTREALVRWIALALYFASALVMPGTAAHRRAIFSLLAGFGFLVSVFAILQRFAGNGKMYWARAVSANIAPYGPYGNYNHFAGFVELLLPLPLAYLLGGRVRSDLRGLWLLCAGLMAAALVLSLSRGGMLAMGLEIALLSLLARRARARVPRIEASDRLVLPLLLVAVAALALWIGYDRLLQRVAVTRQGAGEYSLVTRAEYWRASWRMFRDRPVTGVGLGAFAAVYPAYGRSTAKYERLEQTHNDYLQLLTDAGLVGGLLGLWFLAELALAARRQWRALPRIHGRERALLLGGLTAVAGLLAHSATDFNLQIPANALLFLFVLALAVSVEPADVE